jgi:hypothetical protein
MQSVLNNGCVVVNSLQNRIVLRVQFTKIYRDRKKKKNNKKMAIKCGVCVQKHSACFDHRRAYACVW